MKTALLSFNNGEVSPYLPHRIDFEKTASSSETFRNFIASPYGSASKRPGLLHLSTAADTAGQNSHLFPFVSSSGDRYLLHFTEDTLTIYREDGTVADSMDFLTGTAPDSPSSATGFWSAPLRLLQIAPINDVLFITHPDTYPLRLSRLADDDWILEFLPFSNPPVVDQNTDPDVSISVLSNPIANQWLTVTAYDETDVTFNDGAEWQCTYDHVSASDTQPGVGTNWKNFWRRKLYSKDDPITLSPVNANITSLIRTYLYLQTATTTGSGEIYICTATHTPNGWAEEPNREGSAALYGIPHNWSPVRGSIGTPRAPGTYCHSDNGHIHLNISDSPAANSPATATSNATWEYIRPFTADFAWQTNTIRPATAGNVYSYLGIAYRALTTITPAWRSSTAEPFTNSGTIDDVFREWNTGLNTDFSDSELWEPINFFLPEHAASAASPGTAYKLSPRREDKDFQIALEALQSNDSSPSQPIAIQGAWNINTYGTWTGIFTVQKSTNNGLTWETIRSYEAIGDRNIADSGTELDPCLLRLFFQRLAGTATTGNQRAVLSPEKQSISGYALADTFVNTATMTGTALTPVMSGLTDDWSEGAFSRVKGFPKAISLHESRLVFSSTEANPVSLWLSQTDDLLNFDQGTEDNESIFVTLAAPFPYPIRWLASQRRLFLGTSDAVWVAGSETSDAALTPSNFNARKYTSTGSAAQQPLLAADSLLFLDRKGSRLHQLAFSSDLESYEPIDLSRLAEHLTQPGLAQIAWQQTREPSLWAITREGQLLQFAFSRRDNIQAWSRHDSAGALFRNVAILPSDTGDDDLFFIVDRNGTTTLERFPQHYQEIQETGQIPGVSAAPLFPYHYLDGITYTGTATTSLTIPAHLVGEVLTLLTVDELGGVTTSTVTPDSTTLTITSTTRAILGKPIDSRLSSLPIDFPETLGQRKRLSRTTLSLYRSKGGKVYNAAEASAQPIPYPSAALSTGWHDVVPDPGNLDIAQLHIIHTDPYPFTLRAALLKIDHQER